MRQQVEEKKATVPFLTFGSKRFKQTIKSHKEVLDKYYAGFEEASKLEGEFKIFLDTNVILRIYSTSFKAREKLIKFFRDYRDRIVLTSQVQWEYVKNRENVINTFNNDVTTTIPADFKKLVVNNLIKFKNDSKSTLVDYPDIWKDLEKLEDTVKTLVEKIEKETTQKNVSTNKIIYNDDFIKVFQEFELLDPLEEDQLKIVKNEYEKFITEIKKSEGDKELFKVFPGCFEKSDKADDPFGDYIIYNEILNYAAQNSKPVIFLTHDVAKGDWMQKSKSPHLHYVENFYQSTNELIYILDGERVLDELLEINFKSLISFKMDADYGDDLSINNIHNFIENYEPFRHLPSTDTGRLYPELLLNGYKTIGQMMETFAISTPAMPLILEKFKGYSRLALFRICMSYADPNYKINSEKSGLVRMNYGFGLQSEKSNNN